MFCMSPFEAIAEPNRRRLLELLRSGERAAGDLVEATGLHKITRRPFPAAQEFEQATAVRLSYGFKRAHAEHIPSQLYNCQGIYYRTVPDKFRLQCMSF